MAFGNQKVVYRTLKFPTMIVLEHFDLYEKYYSLDPTTGQVQPVAKRDDRFFGFLSFLQSDLIAALYRVRGVLTLQIGTQTWVYGSGTTTTYQHDYDHPDGAHTVFRVVQDGAIAYERIYRSWWRSPDVVFSIAEGKPADEEEDFLSYVDEKFKLESERAGRKSDLVWHSAEEEAI